MQSLKVGSNKSKSIEPTSKRHFFKQIFVNSGLSVIIGVLWASFVNESKNYALTIRPPGAISENNFLALCIKCGLCVEACRKAIGDRDYPLKLAKPKENKTIGAPYFVPRDNPCWMCVDVPCVPPCPTGALDKNLLYDDKGKLNINKSRMGLAVIDRETCVAFWGIQCDVCYRACPLIDKAISLEYNKNERTGKHAFLTPKVNSKFCTGCGICEKRCITEKPAIYILPTSIAMGKLGPRYIRGWDSNDEMRLKEASPDVRLPKTGRSENNPLDYLNKEGRFDE
ncbi:MAG: ferredoxin-type protein NapG [Spirochaetota bacterium]|nr:ferredoxin-type protein NapG [Spirochaetota bacterium]